VSSAIRAHCHVTSFMVSINKMAADHIVHSGSGFKCLRPRECWAPESESHSKHEFCLFVCVVLCVSSGLVRADPPYKESY
jgi:hypothetical protein